VTGDILAEARSQVLRGMLGGINPIIAGNYLTTLGRPAQADLDMLSRLTMPIKAPSSTL
jgi:biotin synthase